MELVGSGRIELEMRFNALKKENCMPSVDTIGRPFPTGAPARCGLVKLLLVIMVALHTHIHKYTHTYINKYT